MNFLGEVAVETQLDWFPRREAVDFESQGGRTLKFTTGVRGTLFESQRLRLHGTMRGGFIRFSETMTGDENGTRTIGPQTHGVVDLGIGVELFPEARWRPRFDIVTSLYLVPGVVLSKPMPGAATALATTDARTEDTYQFSAGVTYGLGAPHSIPKSTEQPERWNLGLLGSYAVGGNLFGLDVAKRGGLGGFVSYHLSRSLYADGTVSTFPEAASGRNPWEGGRVLQALGGLKVGRQGKRVGVFVKSRFGVHSHAEAVQGRTSSPYVVTLGRSNLPVLDVGGILELRTSDHLLLRVEAGNAITFYPERTVLLDGVPATQPSSPASQQIQLSVGIGWRF